MITLKVSISNLFPPPKIDNNVIEWMKAPVLSGIMIHDTWRKTQIGKFK